MTHLPRDNEHDDISEWPPPVRGPRPSGRRTGQTVGERKALEAPLWHRWGLHYPDLHVPPNGPQAAPRSEDQELDLQGCEEASSRFVQATNIYKGQS